MANETGADKKIKEEKKKADEALTKAKKAAEEKNVTIADSKSLQSFSVENDNVCCDSVLKSGGSVLWRVNVTQNAVSSDAAVRGAAENIAKASAVASAWEALKGVADKACANQECPKKAAERFEVKTANTILTMTMMTSAPDKKTGKANYAATSVAGTTWTYERKCIAK